MKPTFTALLACLVFASCAPSTPQSRIAKSPETFATLNKKQQSLVQQGQLGTGMSPNAVLLAWGSPDRRFEGSQNSKRTERWDYSTLRPVYPIGHYGYGYGSYYGPYGRHIHSGFGYVGPEVAYLPERTASVWFVNDRVDSWERVR